MCEKRTFLQVMKKNMQTWGYDASMQQALACLRLLGACRPLTTLRLKNVHYGASFVGVSGSWPIAVAQLCAHVAARCTALAKHDLSFGFCARVLAPEVLLGLVNEPVRVHRFRVAPHCWALAEHSAHPSRGRAKQYSLAKVGLSLRYMAADCSVAPHGRFHCRSMFRVGNRRGGRIVEWAVMYNL